MSKAEIQPGTIAYAALPNWVKETIKKQQHEYVEYFEAKWKEGLDPILLDLPITEEDKLPASVLDLLEVSEPGNRFKFVLQGGNRVIGISTHLGPVVLYEVDLMTKVPLDEKFTKFAMCSLRNLKLHAAEIFWQSELLQLNHNGGVNVVTFMYAFGMSSARNPGATEEVLNANTIDIKIARIVAALDARRK